MQTAGELDSHVDHDKVAGGLLTGNSGWQSPTTLKAIAQNSGEQRPYIRRLICRPWRRGLPQARADTLWDESKNFIDCGEDVADLLEMGCDGRDLVMQSFQALVCIFDLL